MTDIECPGKRNFLGLRDNYSSLDSSLFHVIPVPYDATSSYVPGSRRGPQAIIDASRNVETYDHDLDMVPASAGVATLDEVAGDVADPGLMVERVEGAVAGAVGRNKIPVVLGGEHTVSVGAVRAVAAGNKAFVVSLDAHADLRDTYQGTKLSHACFLRRTREITDCCVFGVRSISREEVDFARASGTRVFYAGEMRDSVRTLDLDFIPRTVYLSIDVDALDPSIMPATGTPEPGGLGWYDLVGLLTRIVSGRRVLGFDVVELSPLAGNHAPDFTAAKLVYKVMGTIVKCASMEDDRTRHG